MGRWKLIVDLLSPAGACVLMMMHVSSELSSVTYVSVDYLSSLVLSVGRGAFLV